MTIQQAQSIEDIRLYQNARRAEGYYWAAVNTVSGIDRANYIRKAVSLYDLSN